MVKQLRSPHSRKAIVLSKLYEAGHKLDLTELQMGSRLPQAVWHAVSELLEEGRVRRIHLVNRETKRQKYYYVITESGKRDLEELGRRQRK